MSKEHLKPIRTHERAVELGRKGGKAKSKAKAMANSIKNLKHGKYSKYFDETYVELVRNPDKFDSILSNQLMKILELKLTPEQEIKLLSALTRAREALLGSKTHNLNVNYDIEAEKVMQRMAKMHTLVNLYEKDEEDINEKTLEITKEDKDVINTREYRKRRI